MLAGRRVLVSGATSGIGKATALKFAAEGASVLATGRNQAALDALKAANATIDVVAADLTQPGECERVVAAAGATLHTLVNCAGVLKGGAVGSAAADVANLRYNLDANLVAPFEMMCAATPLLRAATAAASPAIINVGSVNGEQSFGGVASYCASKAALHMLSKCAAVDLAPDGIRVCVVAPGVVRTELQRRGGLDDAAYKAFIERSIQTTHPLGGALQRVAEPEEVAAMICFLASPQCAFVSGAVVTIDGARGCVGAR